LKLVAGDTVHLLDGFYPSLRIENVKGTAQQPIKVVGSKAAVIAGKLEIRTSSYTTLDGFTVETPDATCVAIKSTNDVQLTNLDIRKCGVDGINVKLSPRLIISQVKVSNVQDSCIAITHEAPAGVYRPDPVLNSQGIIIQDSLITDCGTDGIVTSSMEIIIRRNRISRIGLVVQDPPVHGIYSYSDNSLIEHNIIDDVVHNGITTRNTAIVRYNTVYNAGNKRSELQDMRGSCYVFFNNGPQDGGLVIFDSNKCTQPGPISHASIHIGGSDTEAAGYTFIIRNNILYHKSRGVTLYQTSQAKVFIENNIIVLSGQGETINGGAKEKIVVNNYEKSNAGAATNIFKNPAGFDFTLLIPFTPVSLPQYTWIPGRHSAELKV
jgi:hypothetical protein